MDSAELILNEDEIRERDTFVERLLASTSGTFDIFTIYLGDRLGFYQTLADKGSLTSTQLATYTDTHERYVREWLEQQTVTGILQVDDEKAEARQRKYRLPAGHADMDERVGETFTAKGNEVDWMMYGWSVGGCLQFKAKLSQSALSLGSLQTWTRLPSSTIYGKKI